MFIDPIDLHFKAYGGGPPLIVLHGLFGAGGNWHSLSRKVFAEHFTVYTVDLRNHGRSPHDDRFDYPAMVADLEHFLDKRGLSEASLLGHSMGGKVAMHAALTHPDRVSKLVVVDIAPRTYPPSHAPIFEALKSVEFSAVASREDVDEQLARRISSRAVRQFVMKNLSYDTETQAYSWQMALEAIHRNYEQINRAVEYDGTYEGPTLFVRGERSDYVREDDESLIRSLFPNARIETVEGAGHWVHADAPDALAEVVVGFLTQEQRRS